MFPTKRVPLMLGVILVVTTVLLRMRKSAVMDADKASQEVPQKVITKRKKGKATKERPIAEKEQHQRKHTADSSKPDKKLKKMEQMGFRERRIVEYENRIRQFSRPDKVFRYFATVSLATPTGTEIYMTPDDFLRAIYPGIRQPDGLGLDKYRRVADNDLNLDLEGSSMFLKLGSDGLISFADFIFLLTILCTSPRHFEIAFQMFDLTGKGYVDIEEFQKVATLARVTSNMGKRQRDVTTGSNTFKGVSSGLIKYFFKDQQLTIKSLLMFQRRFTSEILSLEFDRHRLNAQGNISEVDFADLILAYAGYPFKKTQSKLQHVKNQYKDYSPGLSKQDYKDFFYFLTSINDIALALMFWRMAGAPVSQLTLKHVAKTVVGLELSDHLCDVVITVFDENRDGELSYNEFIAVMKKRVNRGLDSPKDMGFIKVMLLLLKCTKESCNRKFGNSFIKSH